MDLTAAIQDNEPVDEEEDENIKTVLQDLGLSTVQNTIYNF